MGITKEKSTRYIDPFNDFAFKRLFSSDESRPVLKGFLNEIFKGRKHITSIQFSKNEYPGELKNEGGATLDVICTDADGSKFLIEVQRGYQKYFKERALFYTSRLISEQAPKGNRKEWAYDLKEVYLIALLENFNLPESDSSEYVHEVRLTNCKTGKIFYNKLAYTYIELLNFVKARDELDSGLDKWLFALKHMKEMTSKPSFLAGPEFEQLFMLANYANLTKEERHMYNTSLKHKWDNKNVMDYAVEEATQRGVLKGKIEVAQSLKEKGMSVAEIQEITGLTTEHLIALKLDK